MHKLKGNVDAVKMKYLLFVFAASLLVALPTRVYQLLAVIDPVNGFYKESDITVSVLYGAVVLFGALFMALSFVSREVPYPKLPVGKNPLLGVASGVMCAGLVWDMLSAIKNIVPANQGSTEIFIGLLRSNLGENGGTFTILRFVCAFFALIYFIVFAISHLNGRASYKEFKLLALSPLCWSMTVLISRLMTAISFVKVSELLFEIFMFVFVMLFFLTFARISSSVYTEDSMWGIYGYGFTAALLAGIVTIPRLVMMAVGVDAVEGYSFSVAHLSVLVFIVSYIFASLGVGFKDGVKNRKAVSEIDIFDDEEIVTKKAAELSDIYDFEEDEADTDAAEEKASEEASADVVEEVSETASEEDLFEEVAESEEIKGEEASSDASGDTVVMEPVSGNTAVEQDISDFAENPEEFLFEDEAPVQETKDKKPSLISKLSKVKKPKKETQIESVEDYTIVSLEDMNRKE